MNAFFQGFADELLKTSAPALHPMLQGVTRHGTLHGKPVKGGPPVGGMKRSKSPKPKKGKKPMKKKAGPYAMLDAASKNIREGGYQGRNPGAPDKVRDFSLLDKLRDRHVKKAALGDPSEGAGRKLREVIQQASSNAKAKNIPGQSGDTISMGLDDPRYGGGLGNLGARRQPSFTNKINPTDTPKAF